MKRGTPSHPKTLDLAGILDVPVYVAVGILESIWQFAMQHAKRGDLGRHRDQAIARAIGWERPADTLVNALVDAGWLDRCDCHRLKIHDWPSHADQGVARSDEVKAVGWLECYQRKASGKLAGSQQGTSEELDSVDGGDTSVGVGGGDDGGGAVADTVPADEVIDYWSQQTGHKVRVRTDKREKIRTRLKAFTVGELKRAVDGAKAHPDYNGEGAKARGKPVVLYLDFDNIFRSDERVSKLLNHIDAIRPVAPAPKLNRPRGLDDPEIWGPRSA